MKLKKFAGQKFILTAAVVSALALGLARAVVPTGPPTFNNPLEFTAAYAPFQEGGVKVFQGGGGGKKMVVVHEYLTATRPFEFEGTNVAARILREMKYEVGQLARLTDHYLAQGDDGSVYSFGQSVTHFTNGTVLGHAGSWLVGGPLAGDPSGTLAETEPTLVMPAIPEPGDSFRPEDLPPDLTVTARVMRTNDAVRSGLGRFTNVVRVVHRPVGQRGYTLSHARDVGLVLHQSRNENWRLISSTLTGTNLAIPTNHFEAPTNAVPPTNTPPETPIIPEPPIDPETPTIPEPPTDPERPTEPEEPETPDEENPEPPSEPEIPNPGPPTLPPFPG